MSCSQEPITIENFVLALQSMSQSAVYAELNRLNNAMAHLRQSNDELAKYIEHEQDTEDLETLVELKSIINENETVISNQKTRIAVIRSVLADRAIHTHIDDPVKSSSRAQEDSLIPPIEPLEGIASQEPEITEQELGPETLAEMDLETNGIYL